MNNIDLMNFWINGSDEDYDTMMYLKAGQKNTWCLFMGHLVIEKLLKALYAKNNKNAPHAPKSHDLIYLAEKNRLKLTERQEDLFDTFTRFNMNGRYDDYKKTFAEKCTNEYTLEQIKNIEEVRKWLKSLLKIEK
ncbi:MAG: HEPN domain-containing protein [Clostridia bacterium]|nr:HEPN domain-containing protein [Clostridia bacterium]